MKQSIIFLFCSYLFISFSYSNVLVVSDIDDTIRQTNVLNLARAATTIINKAPEFSYLRDIFNQLRFHYSKQNVDFYYLSASPKCMLDYHTWVLERNFPAGPVIQRPCNTTWLIPDYSAKYKFNTIASIIRKKIAESSLTKIILFGDNAEHDPVVYQKIKNEFPEYSVEIFIRDIRVEATAVDSELAVKKLDGVQYFLTEFDLLKFSKFYFLSQKQIEEIKSAYKTAKLFPKYLYENLAKRYEKELNYDDDRALVLAYDALLDQLTNDL
jgi:phosphatidate phosphatase APP1